MSMTNMVKIDSVNCLNRPLFVKNILVSGVDILDSQCVGECGPLNY